MQKILIVLVSLFLSGLLYAEPANAGDLRLQSALGL